MALSRMQQTRPRITVSPIAAMVWLSTLLVSALPDIVLIQLVGTSVQPGIFLMKILLLVLFILYFWSWMPVQSLRYYLILLLCNRVGWWLLPNIRQTAVWAAWEAESPWAYGMFGIQFLKLWIALFALAVLFAIYKRRSMFFLVKGQLNAVANPVHWMGIGQRTSWRALGPIIAFTASGTLLVVLALSNSVSPDAVTKALPLMPVVVVLAAANALSEEISYRVSLLAPLALVIHPGRALMLTAVFFGLEHASGGVPLASLPTVFMTGFLGWIMGKSMLETQGFTWAWFIHFINDIPVFAFLAIASAA